MVENEHGRVHDERDPVEQPAGIIWRARSPKLGELEIREGEASSSRSTIQLEQSHRVALPLGRRDAGEERAAHRSWSEIGTPPGRKPGFAQSANRA